MNSNIKEFPPINQRIKELVNRYSDGNVSNFIELIKFNKHQNFNRLFNIDKRNGKYPSPSAEILNCIKINLPEVNYDWILTGEGEMLKGDTNDPTMVYRGKDETIVINQNNLSVMLIPQYSLDVAGGGNNTEIDTFGHIIGHTPFTMGSRGDICCPVSGKSMYPTYPPGCIVLLRPVGLWREFLELGRVYVIELMDGRRLIKELQNGVDADHYILHSYNDHYPDVDLKKELIRRVYLVIAKYENELM